MAGRSLPTGSTVRSSNGTLRRRSGITTPNFERIPLMPGQVSGRTPGSQLTGAGRYDYESGLIATIDTARAACRATNPIKEISDLALSPDGRFAYVVSTDRTLRRWDSARRFDKVSLPAHPSRRTWSVFLPAGGRSPCPPV
jgi:WD40 repeat protein